MFTATLIAAAEFSRMSFDTSREIVRGEIVRLAAEERL